MKKILLLLPFILITSCSTTNNISNDNSLDKETIEWYSSLNFLNDGECRIDGYRKQNTDYFLNLKYNDIDVKFGNVMKIVIKGELEVVNVSHEYTYVFSAWSNGEENMNMNVVKVSDLGLERYVFETISQSNFANARRFYLSFSNDPNGWTHKLNEKLDETFMLCVLDCPTIG